MRILLSVDESPYSQMSVKMLEALQLSSSTDITLMTVVPQPTFLGGVTINRLRHAQTAKKEQVQQRAAELLQDPVKVLSANGLNVESVVRWGNPAEEIIKMAQTMRADLVVIGAKGMGDPDRFPLGSVAHNVMKYSGTSVLLVRERISKIRRVLVATDGSKHSDEVTRFLLDLPLPHTSHIYFATALQSHIATYLKMPTLNLETNRELLEELKATEERAAQHILSKAETRFQERKYNTSPMLRQGEPAEAILMVADTLYPEIIALGASGQTRIAAFHMGDVAQRVARFSRNSVLIVRMPKERL
jgi:nucleotide-binding universal stress UspA family protein